MVVRRVVYLADKIAAVAAEPALECLFVRVVQVVLQLLPVFSWVGRRNYQLKADRQPGDQYL
jgi:hypothetical protein